MCLSKSITYLFTLAVPACLFLGAASLMAQDTGRDGFPLPEPGQGGGGSQSCFETSGAPGCNDEECEATVCAVDDFCCSVSWDELCVEAAFELCEQPADDPRARFLVQKDFADDNPNEVEVSISCNTGLPLDQSKLISEGAGVTFVVTEFDDGELDCEITETVPAGYSAEYQPSPGTTNSESCTFLDLPWGAFTSCTIVNSPDPVEVVVHKDWVIEGTDDPAGISQEFRIDLFCDSEILEGNQPNGLWHAFDFGDGDETLTFHVIPDFPDTDCTVVETVFDSAVESENGCGSFTVSAGDGHECTITNTVFFEGIPTLSQYGMAILALLMLGVGFVGFRRFT